MLRLFLSLLMLVCFSSCDCYQRVSGTVVDKESGQPLVGATVYNKRKDWSPVFTDSTGYFELSSISGGFRCPPMDIIIKAEKYQIVEKSISSGANVIIELSR